MEAERFAKKTKLVEDADEPELDTSSNSTEAAASETPHQNQELSTQPQVKVVAQPNSQLPDVSLFAPTHGARSNPLTSLYFANSRVSLLLLVLLLFIAASVISTALGQRSADEDLFRKYIDDAELFTRERQFTQASHCWNSALAAAIRLGDNDKSIADLHIKAAEHDKSQAQFDLRSAIALYEKTPNTTLQLIKAKEQLLRSLHGYGPGSEMKSDDSDVLAAQLEREINKTGHAGKLWNENKIKELILSYKSRPLPEIKGDWLTFVLTPLEGKLKRGDSLAETALPIFEKALYDSIKNSTEESDVPWQAQTNLDKVVAKAGRNPGSVKDRLLLANQAFARQDYRGATVEYQRYLGMKDDDAFARGRLEECYRLLNPSPHESAQIITVATDLKNLQTQALGKNSKHVTTSLGELGAAYLEAGDLQKAEEQFETVLRRLIAQQRIEPGEEFGDLVGFPEDYRSLSGGYTRLLNLYVLEGKFQKAKQLYEQSQREASTKLLLSTSYRAACIRAGWFDQAEKLSPTTQNQH
ncbi:hypothetical protein BH10CYA1_BH10CYA1_15750 [soil metagenome]